MSDFLLGHIKVKVEQYCQPLVQEQLTAMSSSPSGQTPIARCSHAPVRMSHSCSPDQSHWRRSAFPPLPAADADSKYARAKRPRSSSTTQDVNIAEAQEPAGEVLVVGHPVQLFAEVRRISCLKREGCGPRSNVVRLEWPGNASGQ